MKADAALRRPARHVVRDAMADEHLVAAVVHAHRDAHREAALGRPQDGADPLVELQPVRGLLEVVLRDVERVQVLRLEIRHAHPILPGVAESASACQANRTFSACTSFIAYAASLPK